MKTLKLIITSLLFLMISSAGFGQEKNEKIKVAGECGMCKKKIESAARSAGASFAEWNVEQKMLTVKYNSSSSNTAKIEKAIAAVGYDTKNEKATDEAYNKLHECCKYERTAASEAKGSCCKDCTGDTCAASCKEGKCDKKMDCCKDGKCEHHSMSEHAAKTDGKSCCKKA